MLRPEFLFLLFGYFITVACFLLWVRHLRDSHALEMRNKTVSGLIKQAEEAMNAPYTPNTPNTHTFKPYTPSTLPAMLAPIANSYAGKQQPIEPKLREKPVKNQKVFSSKASKSKTRKTVTVKKRVTK
jgi:hypothetical protein